MSDTKAGIDTGNTVNSQDILKKFDKESDYRTYTGLMARIVTAIAIAFSCFQLYTALFGVFDAMLQRSIHLSFGMALITCSTRRQKNGRGTGSIRWISDWLLSERSYLLTSS